MQLFPRLVFDGTRIILEPLHMPLKLFILFGQASNLLVQQPGVSSFLFESSQPILSEDDMVPHTHGKGGRRHRGSPTPLTIECAAKLAPGIYR
jgi:hypothetical protein